MAQRSRGWMALLACGMPLVAWPDAGPVAPPVPLRLAPGIWLVPEMLHDGYEPDGNSVVFEAPRGLVIVDSGRHAWHREALLRLARERGKPIAAIVNSHWHLDHTSGNPALRAAFPALKVYASDAIDGALRGFLADSVAANRTQLDDPQLPATIRDDLRADSANITDGAALRPDVVIASSGARLIGGRSLQLNLARDAATAGDVWLFDRATGIAALGDLVTLPAPFLDTACPDGWQAALRAVAATPFRLAVPGHGAPMDRPQFLAYQRAFDAFVRCAASDDDRQACAGGWAQAVAPLTSASEQAQAKGYAAYYVDLLRANGGRSKYCGAPAAISAPPATRTSGNGFGFAVMRADTGRLTRFYAHPHAYTRADPAQPLGEGIPTTQFIEALWRAGPHGDEAGGDEAGTVHYVQQSQVMRYGTRHGSADAWMPFGLAQPMLVVAWHAKPGDRSRWQLRWSKPVASRESMHGDVALLHFEGTAESLMLVPLDATRTGLAAAAGAEAGLERHDAWALVSIEPGADPLAALATLRRWQGARSAAQLLARELAGFERWRVPIPAHIIDAQSRRTWRQSEAVLRMGQSREPDTPLRHGNGLIVAALPGGEWFTPWVRDMAYATVALARMGHLAEARAALLAWFNARPTGLMRGQLAGADYQVSVVRYFGDGAEEPFFTQEGSTNVELDNWGLVLWALGEYLQRAPGDALLATATHRGSVYESARDFIVRPLLANLETTGDGAIVRADTSIWEEHEADRRHFAWTTATAIVGLQAFAQMARQQGDTAARAEAGRAIGQLRRGFDAAFIRDGSLRGTQEPGIKNDIDGALPALIGLGVVGDPALVADVVARMAALQVASGGYRRVRGTYTDPKIFEYWYEQQEFVFVDLALAGVLRQLGRQAEAAQLLRKVLDDAAAHDGLVPEMYVSVPCELFPGKIGEPTGANPMVGYGAGALVMELLQSR